MSFYWNARRTPRFVECYCGNVFRSQVETCQCSKCHIRFSGDDRLYKTNEDRVKERKEMYGDLSELKTKLSDIIETIKKMQDRLKPVD